MYQPADLMQLDTFALANTLAVLDLILHPLIHVWVAFSPHSYERMMNTFVAGLHLKVESSETSVSHIIFGTIAEAGTLWVLGVIFTCLYNWFAR